MTTYPAILDEIRFIGIGSDGKMFDGSVLYIRNLASHQHPMSTSGGVCKDELDDIIIAYVKNNLSECCNDVRVNLNSHIINSANDIKMPLKKNGSDFKYDCKTFEFIIYPNFPILVNRSAKGIDFTNVFVENLIVCTRAGSKEMIETLLSCFCNLKFSYADLDIWSQKHPMLSSMAAGIESVIDFMPDNSQYKLKNGKPIVNVKVMR